MPLLKLTDVSAGYNQTPVLVNINMMIEKGDIACLLGRNGMGKTTLLRSIIGLNKVIKGDIVFDADDITHVPTYKRARYGIAFIPQGREIIPYLSVLDNLKLGLAASRKKLSKIPDEIFEFFPMLKQHLKRQGGLLSGGQQQQLAIARGLMCNPQVMLLDEPTEGIQPSIILEIEAAVRRIIEATGISVLLVEQHLHFVRQADWYYAMQKGGIVASGATSELSQDVVQRFLAV